MAGNEGLYFLSEAAKGKGRRKKKGQEEDEGSAEEGGRRRKGRKKAAKDNGEDEPHTDDEIWKQYGSDADLDAPYIPKVSIPLIL